MIGVLVVGLFCLAVFYSFRVFVYNKLAFRNGHYDQGKEKSSFGLSRLQFVEIE